MARALPQPYIPPPKLKCGPTLAKDRRHAPPAGRLGLTLAVRLASRLASLDARPGCRAEPLPSPPPTVEEHCPLLVVQGDTARLLPVHRSSTRRAVRRFGRSRA